MNSLQKDKPYRDKKYRVWVQSLPCVITDREGSEVVPHHAISCGLGGSTGGKIGDNYCFPLIQVLHKELHDDPKKWEEKYGKQLKYVYETVDQAGDRLPAFLKFTTGLEDE